MLPVDQLVPLPIVGKEHKVVVGELHGGVGGPRMIPPGHALILPVVHGSGVPAQKPVTPGPLTRNPAYVRGAGAAKRTRQMRTQKMRGCGSGPVAECARILRLR